MMLPTSKYERFLDRLYEDHPYMISQVISAAVYPNSNPLGSDAEEFIYLRRKRFLPIDDMYIDEWETLASANSTEKQID